MKNDQKNLAVGAAVIVVIFLGLLASIFRPASLDAVYFQNTEFEKNDFRVKHGTGVTLSIRKTKSGLLSLNTQERISMWISDLKESTYEFGEPSKLIGHFWKSVTDHPELSCEARIQSGQLEILSVHADYIKIRILASFDCIKKDGTPFEAIRLDQGYALTSQAHQDYKKVD